MRVAIIVPPYPLSEAPAPPLGVTYVAAAFEKAGAKVRIFDYLVSHYTPAKLKNHLDEFSPDVLGITSVTLNFPDAAMILSQAKRFSPDLVTLMGGPHVSFSAEQTLRAYPEIDLIVRGEGERTIAELMAARMDPSAWPGIRGLTYRRDSAIIENAPQLFIENLDELPFPSRHLLPLSRYQALGYPISIITSRGCPYTCIFCLGRRMVGSRIRQRNPSLVVDEIEAILSYGIDRINVADDLFVSQRGNVKEVCEEILRRDLRFGWSAFARVNTVDRETLRLMKKAGCDSVSFGVETGNAELLKRIRKGITREQVREAIALCREAGIIAHTSFIVGLPGESPETLMETKEFAAGLGSLYGYHFLTPFPGTTLREERQKYDIEILTEDWTRYDANSAIVQTSRLSPAQMESFVAEYENEIDALWQSMVRGYHDRTNSPQMDMQVEGHFRMQLIYRLLSEDLIERANITSAGECERGEGNVDFEVLCRWVGQLTGADPALIRKTLLSLISLGYLKAEKINDSPSWFWTHNRFIDRIS